MFHVIVFLKRALRQVCSDYIPQLFFKARFRHAALIVIQLRLAAVIIFEIAELLFELQPLNCSKPMPKQQMHPRLPFHLSKVAIKVILCFLAQFLLD